MTLTADIESAGRLEADAGSARLIQGPKGEPGAVYVPSVSASGVMSWTNDGGLPNPEPVDITGPQGEKGDTGAQGPKGDKGDRGDTGPQGETGPQGVQGLQGVKGDKGDKGDTGYLFTPSVSSEGVISWTNDGGLENPEPVDIRGPKGDRGDTGDTGPAGPQGEAGPQGIQGEQGPQGPQGPKGDTGSGLDILGQYDTPADLQSSVTDPEIGDNYYVGTSSPYSIYTWTSVNGTPQWIDGGQLQGAKGDTGPQGPSGADGADGTTFTPSVSPDGVLSWTNDGNKANPPPVNIRGPQGIQGPAGADGDTGPQGPQGEQGPAGAAGAAGADGADGEDGGYYTPAVDASGNLTWTASKSGMAQVSGANIRGPQGATGETGPQGPAGADGQDGAQGPQGPAGAAGADATINGVNALTLTAGNNMALEQSGSTVELSAEPVLLVNITGEVTSAGNVTADRTVAEINAAVQEGKAVIAKWESRLFTLTLVEETAAYFSYASGGTTGWISMVSMSGLVANAGGVETLRAAAISYDDEETQLGATNVQDAIETLASMLT